MKKLVILLIAVLLSASLAQDLGGKTLVVGSDTTFPPFESINDEGVTVGFDVDVLKAVCEKINCVVEFQTTAWDGIFAALAQGEFDLVASGVTITEERDEVVDFSDPYYYANQAIALRPEDDGLTLEDLKAGNQVLGAQVGTTNAILAEELFGRDRLSLYDDFNSAVLALINGDVDAVVIDGGAAKEFAQQYAGDVIVGITGVTGEDPEAYGFAAQEGDEILEAINAGLAAINEDGTYVRIYKKWFGN
ncbi:MAG TPA: basic amino acid ABC transporter substrate-binding protein [Trueperaceae bacterium]|nr:basic amino acid ABC transporter substrate-binding protein [Trueperaceae bacterium]